MKILADYKILDLGSFITAPHASMLMGELGADVIKVERPGTGDPFRWHNDGLSSPIFQAHNRNKRSIALDFTEPEGLEVLDRLVAWADVVVINVRPGVDVKLKIDEERLRRINPRLVYCSITGFGSSGPYAKRPAYDTVGMAMSGLISRIHQGEDPRVAGPSMSDTVTGMIACIGVLAALLERSRTGKGRLVETNMLEATLSFAIDPMIYLLVTGNLQPYFQRGAASQAYVLLCRDERRLCLHMSSPDKFWSSLADAIERPDLKQQYPDRVSRGENYESIGKVLASVFRTRDRAEWMRILEEHDVPFAPELSGEEMLDDPQVRHLGVFNETSHKGLGATRGVNRALHFDGDNQSSFYGTPRLGEHTLEILGQIGLNENAVKTLVDRQICQLGIPA
jgi:crotonobetainyl-CoA:carnitine CoA-transferase CaiB-like acyl-CoA transferase